MHLNMFDGRDAELLFFTNLLNGMTIKIGLNGAWIADQDVLIGKLRFYDDSIVTENVLLWLQLLHSW